MLCYNSSGGLSLEGVDSLRIALIASRFAESRGVKPQVAHTVALAPPDPAVRRASLANEVFATWAFPLLSATLHQSRIAILHLLAAGEVSRLTGGKPVRACDGGACDALGPETRFHCDGIPSERVGLIPRSGIRARAVPETSFQTGSRHYCSTVDPGSVRPGRGGRCGKARGSRRSRACGPRGRRRPCHRSDARP